MSPLYSNYNGWGFENRLLLLFLNDCEGVFFHESNPGDKLKQMESTLNISPNQGTPSVLRKQMLEKFYLKSNGRNKIFEKKMHGIEVSQDRTTAVKLLARFCKSHEKA